MDFTLSLVLQNNPAARLFLIAEKENKKNNIDNLDQNSDMAINNGEYRTTNISNHKNKENIGYDIVKRCVQVINTSLSHLQAPNTSSNTTSTSATPKTTTKDNTDQKIRARTDVSTDVLTDLKSEKVKTALHFLKRKQKNDTLNEKYNGDSGIQYGQRESTNNGNDKIEIRKISSESGVESFSTSPPPPQLAFGSRTTPHPKYRNISDNENNDTPVDYRKNGSPFPGSGGQNGPSFHGSGAPTPDKMRSRARGYIWKESNTPETQLNGPQTPVNVNSKVSIKNGQDCTELPPTHRLALYSSLLLLQNALPDCPRTQVYKYINIYINEYASIYALMHIEY